MAKADLKIVKHAGPTLKLRVDDRTTTSATATIKPGEPVRRGDGTPASNFVELLATGEPTIGSTTQPFVGIARKESTETSTVDGEVEVITLVPGLSTIRGKMTTPANVDTDDELEGVLLDFVAFDLTSTTFTIDEDEGDDPNVHGLCIVGGDIVRGTLDVIPHVLATIFGALTGQTMD